jgi:hypothetical protein
MDSVAHVPMERIHPDCFLIAIGALFGWRTLILTIASSLVFVAVVWRPARRHALEMTRNLEKTMHDHEER